MILEETDDVKRGVMSNKINSIIAILPELKPE
jgi:hypothetical protein